MVRPICAMAFRAFAADGPTSVVVSAADRQISDDLVAKRYMLAEDAAMLAKQAAEGRRHQASRPQHATQRPRAAMALRCASAHDVRARTETRPQAPQDAATSR
jgi:hypothetical protein